MEKILFWYPIILAEVVINVLEFLVTVFYLHKLIYASKTTEDDPYVTSLTLYLQVSSPANILTSVGSGEPVQPPFKLRNSKDVQSVA